jgi:hypothetical protein
VVFNCLLTLLSLIWAEPVQAADPLQLLVCKAELIVAAEITSQPVGWSTEDGVVEYVLDLKLVDRLKGSGAPRANLTVKGVRLEASPSDRLPYLVKGAKVVLFLKATKDGSLQSWETVDPYFGIQPRSEPMIRDIKLSVTHLEKRSPR